MNSRRRMARLVTRSCEEKDTPLLNINTISRLKVGVCDLPHLTEGRTAASGARICCGCSGPVLARSAPYLPKLPNEDP